MLSAISYSIKRAISIFRSSSSRIISLLFIAVGCALLIACTQDLRQNTEFNEAMSTVREFGGSITEIKKKLASIESDVDRLKVDLDKYRSEINVLSELAPQLSGTNGTAIAAQISERSSAQKALESRVAQLEANLNAIQKNLGDARPQNQDLNHTSQRQEPIEENPELTDPFDTSEDKRPSSPPTKQVKTPKPTPKITPKPTDKPIAKQTPSKTPEEKPVSTAGVYHTVKAGETIESIAQRYKTTPPKIVKANRLPKTAQLYVGQSLFIPKD